MTIYYTVPYVLQDETRSVGMDYIIYTHIGRYITLCVYIYIITYYLFAYILYGTMYIGVPGRAMLGKHPTEVPPNIFYYYTSANCSTCTKPMFSKRTYYTAVACGILPNS